MAKHEQGCRVWSGYECTCSTTNRSLFAAEAELAAAKLRIGKLEQALQEIGKHTMESEDDIDFIIDACRNALRVADRAAG